MRLGKELVYTFLRYFDLTEGLPTEQFEIKDLAARRLIDYSVSDTDVGATELKGRRPYQEDSIAFGAVDGFHLLSDDEKTAFLKELYRRLQQNHGQQREIGSTAVTAVINRQDGKFSITTAHAGDSEAFVYRRSETPSRLEPLIEVLHNPSSPSEKQRIEGAGGVVDGKRLGGRFGLAVSRGLGDTAHEAYHLSHDPDIGTHNLDSPDEGERIFVIAACDGLREGFNKAAKRVNKDLEGDALTTKVNNDINAFIQENLQANSDITCEELSQALAEEAIRRGSRDNVSVVVREVKADMPDGAYAVNVFDGHGEEELGHVVSQALGNNFMADFQGLYNELYLNPEEERFSSYLADDDFSAAMNDATTSYAQYRVLADLAKGAATTGLGQGDNNKFVHLKPAFIFSEMIKRQNLSNPEILQELFAEELRSGKVFSETDFKAEYDNGMEPANLAAYLKSNEFANVAASQDRDQSVEEYSFDINEEAAADKPEGRYNTLASLARDAAAKGLGRAGNKHTYTHLSPEHIFAEMIKAKEFENQDLLNDIFALEKALLQSDLAGHEYSDLRQKVKNLKRKVFDNLDAEDSYSVTQLRHTVQSTTEFVNEVARLHKQYQPAQQSSRTEDQQRDLTTELGEAADKYYAKAVPAMPKKWAVGETVMAVIGAVVGAVIGTVAGLFLAPIAAAVASGPTAGWGAAPAGILTLAGCIALGFNLGLGAGVKGTREVYARFFKSPPKQDLDQAVEDIVKEVKKPPGPSPV
ncbi:MAG: hypothetical protein CMF50_03115 [Legionellales bacterium]|nr:hypothetical protein [Legionellales bacterium]